MSDNNKRRTTRIAVGCKTQVQFDGQTYPVELTDVSYGGVSVKAEVKPPIETEVTLMDETLGEIEGLVVRHIEGGFAVAAKPGESMAKYALRAITSGMSKK